MKACLPAILVLGLFVQDGKVTIGKITWYTDYDKAMAQAKKESRPLWLHFGENPG
jgi:hypothetical protein